MDASIMAITPTKLKLARKQWDRYTAAMDRGHTDFQRQALKNEDFYMGAGFQWDADVKAALEAMNKPWLEENIIFATVNTVLGYQTQSRMDIAYKPREIGDQETSDILTKLGMFIVDQNRFPWVESQVFADGMIQQRGYFDIRMSFDENINGDIKIKALDPLDVIPDPDAKSYDPSDWSDVITTNWMSVDDIRTTYGLGAYRQVIEAIAKGSEPDFGSDELGVERNRFANRGTYSSFYREFEGDEHVRVLERQWYQLTNREFYYDLETGDLIPVPDSISSKDKKRIAKENNYELIKRTVKRVRWTVSTYDAILHDAWSPYEFFTIVPFFPYFRRGRTVGMVDNLIKTQEMLNKTFSQILHIVNTTANSGWIVDENSLSNMEIEELEERGSETGLILEVRAGRERPAKIEPNQIPTGLKEMLNSGIELIRMISGVSETFQGGKGPEVSGTAIQSRVHQSAIQLATPIDNLFRTRNMMGERILKLIQQFYTEKRTFLITSENNENNEPEQVTINDSDEFGNIINDITVGKYDIVIADVPTQITFQNAQFQQALDMRKFGVNIPDDEMILMSTLSRKNEIAKKVSGEQSDEQQAMAMEQFEMQIQQLEEQIKKIQSESYNKQVDAAKKAAEIAQMIAENPSIGPIIDSIISQNNPPSDEVLANERQEIEDNQQNRLGQLNFS